MFDNVFAKISQIEKTASRMVERELDRKETQTRKAARTAKSHMYFETRDTPNNIYANFS